MKKCTGAVISWLIQQQAITEEDREIYTYAVDNMVFLLIPLAMVLVIGGYYTYHTTGNCDDYTFYVITEV